MYNNCIIFVLEEVAEMLLGSPSDLVEKILIEVSDNVELEIIPALQHLLSLDQVLFIQFIQCIQCV